MKMFWDSFSIHISAKNSVHVGAFKEVCIHTILRYVGVKWNKKSPKLDVSKSLKKDN